MANRHVGRLADIFKHLVLADLLDVQRPTLYAETHAGNAVYPEQAPSPGTVPAPRDPVTERVHGVARFLDAMGRDPRLGDSAYGGILREHAAGSATIPGSPAVAMGVLRDHATYLLCDVDSDSTADVERWAVTVGLGDRVATVTADGMRAVGRRVLGGSADPRSTFVHVDPYDPWAAGAGGVSALGLTRALIAEGVAVMYWYGFDTPARSRWAAAELAGDVGLWCGVAMVTDGAGDTRDDGDLGAATTPGTGSGVVCANVTGDATARCEVLGRALAEGYAGVPLPSGEPGGLMFEVVRA
jgi:23S rRNA A2030 N6-methylase RlmJ